MKRIYAKDANDDDILDISVDVARIDEALVNNGPETKASSEYAALSWPFGDADKQGSKLHVQWEDTHKENNNPTRKTEKRIIRNPQDPSSGETDGSPAVKLDIIVKTHFQTKVRQQNETLGHIWNFNNNPKDPNSPDNDGGAPNTARKVKAIRVVNNDLDGLDMTNPVKWDDYLTALKKGKQDTSQYVDAEVMQKFTVAQRNGSQTQNAAVTLNNDDVIKQFDASPSDAYLVRLDPFQIIVNVQWGGLVVVVDLDGTAFSSTDGKKWRVSYDLTKYGLPVSRQGALSYDVTTKTYFCMFTDGSSSSVASSTDDTKSWAISGGWEKKTGDEIANRDIEDGGITCWEATGLLKNQLDLSPFSINGGKDWNFKGVEPDAVYVKGPLYPASTFTFAKDDDHIKYIVFNDGVDADDYLVNVDTGARLPLTAPTPAQLGDAGDDDMPTAGIQGAYATGNGVIAGLFVSTGSPAQLGVSTDNITWKTYSAIGDIPSFVPFGFDTGGVPAGATPIGEGFLIFAPGIGKFVFTGNQYRPVFDTDDDFVGAGVYPTEIYTSHDAVTWTQAYFAGYQPWESPPAAVTTAGGTYQVYVINGFGPTGADGFGGGQQVYFTDLIESHGVPIAIPAGWTYDLTSTTPTVTIKDPTTGEIFGVYPLVYGEVFGITEPLVIAPGTTLQGGANPVSGMAAKYPALSPDILKLF